MSILSTVATILESAAASLRRADEPTSRAAIVAPLRAVRDAVSPPHPGGFWRCTHSTFDDFVVGMAYHCREQSGTSCMRIYPHSGSFWAPYWQPHDGRFCYPAKDLEFVYLGRTLPDGETVDARTGEERKAARLAARGMAMAA
jgi:hypothetical protein